MKARDILAAAVLLAAISCSAHRAVPPQSPQASDLAACLSGRGYTAYVASYCWHCHDQLELFGSGADRLNAVVCKEKLYDPRSPECVSVDIKSYPTWIGPDGSRRVGTQTLDQLAQWSGCSQ